MESVLFLKETCNFAYKVINNADFLHLFAVNDFNCTNDNFINQPIQNGFIQLGNGRIFPDFPDEPAHIVLRVAGGTQFIRDHLHPGLVVRLFLLQRFSHAEEPLLSQNAFGLVGVQVYEHFVNFLVALR